LMRCVASWVRSEHNAPVIQAYVNVDCSPVTCSMCRRGFRRGHVRLEVEGSDVCDRCAYAVEPDLALAARRLNDQIDDAVLDRWYPRGSVVLECLMPREEPLRLGMMNAATVYLIECRPSEEYSQGLALVFTT
jgi:hypothetical protein